MLVYADLHSHTTASDGILSAQSLLNKAQHTNLRVLSITDHDTIAAYEQLNTSQFDSIDVIYGIELTTQYRNRECHLLIYGSEVFEPVISSILQQTKILRKNRALDIITYLSAKGISIEFDEVNAEADFGSIGRPHFARLLVKKAWVSSMNEAFIRYLSDQHVAHLMPAYPLLEEVLNTIKRTNLIASVAHPGTRFSSQELTELKKLGLRAIEVFHPSHSHYVQQYLTDMAVRFNLLQTGGSDFHGTKTSCTENFGTFGIEKDLYLAFKSEYS